MPPYNNRFSDIDTPADLAVVGLGPGGLAAALEAAAAGKQVLAFSDRAEYVRGQRVLVSPETSQFLQKYTDASDPADQLFWQKFQEEGTIQTKDIEKFLYRKLIQYPNAQVIQLEKPDKIAAVANTEGQSTAIELSNGQKFHAQNILAADGVHHGFARLMNQDLQANIDYRKSSVQERHRYHAVVQLKLKYDDCFFLNSSRDPQTMAREELQDLFENKDGCILHNANLFYFEQKTGTLTQIDQAKAVKLVDVIQGLTEDEKRLASFREHKLISTARSETRPPRPPAANATHIAHRAMGYMRQGWDAAYEPKHYVFSDANRTKFYFAGEIPKTIFDEPDAKKRAEQLQQWAGAAIHQWYGYSATELEYRKSPQTPAKDRLQATVFEMEMHVSQQPLVKLAGGFFAQVGDARRTPNYNLGHGLNDAIAGGVGFTKALGSPTHPAFNEGQFTRLIKEMDKSVESGMRTRKLQPMQKKLLSSIDKLITHLEKKPMNIGDETIMSLKWARHDIANDKPIAKLQEAIALIQPLVDQHQHRDTGLGYRVWRWLASLFSESASKTKSTNLLEDVTTDMEKNQQHH